MILNRVSLNGRFHFHPYISFSQSLYFTPPERCTGLPSDSNLLITTQRFPVEYGALVTVLCDPGNSMELRGDTVITCTDGVQFASTDKPRCNDPGKGEASKYNLKLLFHLLNFQDYNIYSTVHVPTV